MALNINQTQLDSYNKSITRGKGTLVSNWHEEAHMREETGEGRIKANSHLPKKHYDLFHCQTDEYPLFQEVIANRVDTTTRLFGKLSPDNPPPASKTFGNTRNPAESIPTVGRRQQLIEQQYLQKITDEIGTQTQQDILQSQERTFTTTHRDGLQSGSIGKRVMRTQDGTAVQARDSNYTFVPKPSLRSDQDFKKSDEKPFIKAISSVKSSSIKN